MFDYAYGGEAKRVIYEQHQAQHDTDKRPGQKAHGFVKLNPACTVTCSELISKQELGHYATPLDNKRRSKHKLKSSYQALIQERKVLIHQSTRNFVLGGISFSVGVC